MSCDTISVTSSSSLEESRARIARILNEKLQRKQEQDVGRVTSDNRTNDVSAAPAIAKHKNDLAKTESLESRVVIKDETKQKEEGQLQCLCAKASKLQTISKPTFHLNFASSKHQQQVADTGVTSPKHSNTPEVVLQLTSQCQIGRASCRERV